MKQLNLFLDEYKIHVPGLGYLPGYISKEEEIEWLNIIDEEQWLTDLKRRVQHYGYRYNYKSKRVSREDLYCSSS